MSRAISPITIPASAGSDSAALLRGSTLHRYEFAADCYAVRALHRSRPDAVVAAVQFFQHRQGQHTDTDHPPMERGPQSPLLPRLASTLNRPKGFVPQ